MLDIANDIRSLSDFKRNTSELLQRLKKTGHPLVPTINGKAEVVVQDAEAYHELLERVETGDSGRAGKRWKVADSLSHDESYLLHPARATPPVKVIPAMNVCVEENRRFEIRSGSLHEFRVVEFDPARHEIGRR